jgi:hypothetical protein
MMGKFPEEPTRKELRTLIGFRLAGLVAFSIFAVWRAWEGNLAGAAFIVLTVIVFFLIFVLPRAIQLKKTPRDGDVQG